LRKPKRFNFLLAILLGLIVLLPLVLYVLWYLLVQRDSLVYLRVDPLTADVKTTRS
jgi:hypothetical protein